MKKLIVGSMILVLVLISAAWLSWQWFKWGPRPDIHVQGQVIDRANGHGVADAYVILALRISNTTYAGTQGGCSAGSAVVRSDQDGKFTYSITAREAFGRENPGSWHVRIFVYHPDFDAGVRSGMENLAMQFLAARPTLDGEWPARPPDLYMTFPHFYDEDEGWATIEVIKRDSSEWEQIEYFTSSPERKCIESPVDRGQSDLINEIHTRAWGLFCRRRSDDSFEPHPDEPDGSRADYLFSSIFYTYLYDVRRNMSETERREITTKKAAYISNSILPLYPRSEDDEDFARDMTIAERENFCALYTPPLASVLRRFEQ